MDPPYTYTEVLAISGDFWRAPNICVGNPSTCGFAIDFGGLTSMLGFAEIELLVECQSSEKMKCLKIGQKKGQKRAAISQLSLRFIHHRSLVSAQTLCACEI